jgi:hypothetical protein
LSDSGADSQPIINSRPLVDGEFDYTAKPPATSGRELMIGCESEPLSLKSEYAFNMSWLSLVLIRLAVVLKLNASRKSKRELIIKSQTRARDSFTPWKGYFGRSTYRLWEKLDFYIVLVGAIKYNENKYRRRP